MPTEAESCVAAYFHLSRQLAKRERRATVAFPPAFEDCLQERADSWIEAECKFARWRHDRLTGAID